MDAGIGDLQRGSPESAWDSFLDRYRRLIFAATRHYAQDYDDVMGTANFWLENHCETENQPGLCEHSLTTHQ